jgi:hypothetical protein
VQYKNLVRTIVILENIVKKDNQIPGELSALLHFGLLLRGRTQSIIFCTNVPLSLLSPVTNPDGLMLEESILDRSV